MDQAAILVTTEHEEHGTKALFRPRLHGSFNAEGSMNMAHQGPRFPKTIGPKSPVRDCRRATDLALVPRHLGSKVKRIRWFRTTEGSRGRGAFTSIPLHFQGVCVHWSRVARLP